MNLVASLFDNRNGMLYDISEIVGNIKITTSLELKQPGKCTFRLIKVENMSFWEGATVTIQIDGFNMFKGYVIKKERDENIEVINVTAVDQLFYLKNKDTLAFVSMSSSDIFAKICREYVLKGTVVNASTFKCPPKVYPDKSLYEMIQTSLDVTMINTGKWYIVRDNFGTLEHVDILNLHSQLVIGDASGLVGFKYTTSIEKDVYNQIKLYRDNDKTKKREVVIVNDTINGGQNLKEWGILQLYEKVDETMNLAQMEARARGLLKLYNSRERTLQLKVVGVPKIFAGSLIGCKIADLGDITMNATLLVTKCEHNIDNEEHIMELEVQVMV